MWAMQVAAMQEELASCQARLDARCGELTSMKRLLAGALQPRMPADPLPRLISLNTVARATTVAAGLPPFLSCQAGRSAALRMKDGTPPAAPPGTTAGTHAAPSATQPGADTLERAGVAHAPPPAPADPDSAVEECERALVTGPAAAVSPVEDGAVTVSINAATSSGNDADARAAPAERPAA